MCSHISPCSFCFFSPCISHQQHPEIQLSHTHRLTETHTHIHAHTQRRPHQGYRGNACGIMSVFEVMPLILKQIWTLCCASPAVCERACPCVKPNLTPITLRLAAHQRHPTATPTWKSGAGLASSTPALIWGQKPTIASHRDAETRKIQFDLPSSRQQECLLRLKLLLLTLPSVRRGIQP